MSKKPLYKKLLSALQTILQTIQEKEMPRAIQEKEMPRDTKNLSAEEQQWIIKVREQAQKVREAAAEAAAEAASTSAVIAEERSQKEVETANTLDINDIETRKKIKENQEQHATKYEEELEARKKELEAIITKSRQTNKFGLHPAQPKKSIFDTFKALLGIQDSKLRKSAKAALKRSAERKRKEAELTQEETSAISIEKTPEALKRVNSSQTKLPVSTSAAAAQARLQSQNATPGQIHAVTSRQTQGSTELRATTKESKFLAERISNGFSKSRNAVSKDVNYVISKTNRNKTNNQGRRRGD